MVVGALTTFSAGSQVRSEYPTQQTRYFKDLVLPTNLESMISSTSYSGSSSMIMGGGRGWTCPGRGSVAAGSRSKTWKTGWIFMDTESSSL